MRAATLFTPALFACFSAIFPFSTSCAPPPPAFWIKFTSFWLIFTRRQGENEPEGRELYPEGSRRRRTGSREWEDGRETGKKRGGKKRRRAHGCRSYADQQGVDCAGQPQRRHIQHQRCESTKPR